MRVALLLAPLHVAAAIVPDGGLFRANRFRDVHLYGEYADAFLAGELPYRDVFVEYPPGAFLVFLPPALGDASQYNPLFKALMTLCGIAAIFAVALALVRLGASRRRLWLGAGLVALSPLAIGPISLNTYDAWPAALTAGALAALLWDRSRLALVLLGLAFAAKVYALVLLGPALFWIWRRRGRREALLAGGGFVVAAAAVIVPFAVLAPDGLWESFTAQSGRALQIESTASAALLAAHRLGLYEASVVMGSTEALSRDLAGRLPDRLATASTALQGLAVAGVWILLARGRLEGERLVTAFAAAVAGFIVFSRFVSPQYLVWLVPLVPLVAPAPGVVAAALLAVSLVLGQLWFFHYDDVFELERIVWLVVGRDALLVTLFVVLAVALSRRRRLA